MTFLDRLERRLAPFAIPGLIRYVVMLHALVFLLILANPDYIGMLVLDRQAILEGQVWRLFSWIFIPGTTSFIWIFFYLMFTWWIGDILESSWGTFRLNLYYFIGVFACALSGFFFGSVVGGTTLSLTLLLAAATLAPNLEILLFFILPLKLKWLAIISLIFPLYNFVFGPLGTKIGVLLCLANYLLFFGPVLFRQARHNREVGTRRARFEAAKAGPESLHRCELCGATEVTNPQADFRVARDGKEYCTDHLPPVTT